MWDELMKPVGGLLQRTGVSPNAITLTGLGIQAGAATLIMADRLLIAGVVATVAAVADTLDGAVAKARGDVRQFGALLDSTADRLSDALFFVPVAWLYGFEPPPGRAGQQWVAALALATLVASFLVSYVKARAEGLGLECNTGIAERAERLIVMIVALLLDIVPAMLVVLAILSIVTFIQRLMYVRAQIPASQRTRHARR